MIQDKLTNEMANSLRFLAIDAVEKANSGHPGMPMGMADVATILFGEFLKFDVKNPKWLNRDRFVLSAGHGSMLLYALLYLVGYEDISLDDIKNFRQLNSKCAGHPEFGHLQAIETTTGPLGQGVANAVGMALAERLLAARIGENLINHKTYCIAGDGCLMEGISQEAISIAGHLNLNKLILLWDNNSISIDGKTSLATSENMKLRFEACGWMVLQIDGHNHEEIRKALLEAQNSQKPVMIDCKTTIAFGSPNKSGSEKSHGSPLGAEEVKQTRNKLNWPYEAFEIPQELLLKWREFGARSSEIFKKWQNDFAKIDPIKLSEIKRILNKELPENFLQEVVDFRQEILAKQPVHATRKSSQVALEFFTSKLSELIGGSADLTESVLTKTSSTEAISKDNFLGRYIHYGIREHAMAAIMNGLALHSNFIPYGGTFLVFSDYMKPAIRLAALMKQQVIYIFTHDSIGLGEDGPTHQPIEHLAALRAIPNINVFRPCDAKETLDCFELALNAKETPSAMVLTRQNLPFVSNDEKNLCAFGGYVLRDVVDYDVVIIASGSEVAVAIEAQEKLALKNIKARVVSMPCFEMFDKQSVDYKNSVLGDSKVLKVAIEAAVEQGWNKYIGCDGIFIGMHDFGASAKAQDLYKHFKITADEVVRKVALRLA
jgi:transketolase